MVVVWSLRILTDIYYKVLQDKLLSNFAVFSFTPFENHNYHGCYILVPKGMDGRMGKHFVQCLHNIFGTCVHPEKVTCNNAEIDPDLPATLHQSHAMLQATFQRWTQNAI